MCEVMEQYSKKAYQQGEEAGKEIGKEIGKEDYTESEYNTAIAELQSESR